jgi:hypothetical protein
MHRSHGVPLTRGRETQVPLRLNLRSASRHDSYPGLWIEPNVKVNQVFRQQQPKLTALEWRGFLVEASQDTCHQTNN